MADAGAKVLRGLLDVFLLESLEQQPKHGYALLREMADAFGTEPNRNRLYPLLGRMVRDGLIVERSDDGGGRTLFALTDNGRAALEQYRALPAPFKDRLARIWSGAIVAPAPIPVAARVVALDGARAPQAPEGAPLNAPAGASASSPQAAAAYPCVDARVSMEKNPRTGDLSVRLTGCPMGAYEYCPQCPVYKSVEGLRRITLS